MKTNIIITLIIIIVVAKRVFFNQDLVYLCIKYQVMYTKKAFFEKQLIIF